LRRPDTTWPLWPYLKPSYSDLGPAWCSSFLRFVCLPTSTVGLRGRGPWCIKEVKEGIGLFMGMSLRESRRSAADSISARSPRMRAEERRRYRSLGVARGRFGFAVGGLLMRLSGGSLSRGGPKSRRMVSCRADCAGVRCGCDRRAPAAARGGEARSGRSPNDRRARLIEPLTRERSAKEGAADACG
jgi:hypothetical protein